ncbi:MAG: M48 family metallopeptidase [Bacilli bacterium]|nr:M48 family metallopeptidase [Bacilli bacterium]
MYFDYNGNKYEIIIEKKNNKNTYIRVKDDLKIYISTSYLIPKFMIKSLIENNRKQINKMIDTVLKRLNKKDGYYYLGMKINIVIKNVKKPYLDYDTLYVNSKEDIDKWYSKMAKKVFKERLDVIYNNFTKEVPYPKLVIRKMTTRWGVCNKNLEKVTLNYNLIYMDKKYLDYVIVHELSHFIHFNHSKNFWKLVEENEPNYKQIRKEMRN